MGCCQYFLRKRLSDFETYSQGAARKFQGFGSGDTFAQHLMQMYRVPQKKFSDFSSIFPAQRPSHHHQQPIQAPIFLYAVGMSLRMCNFFFIFIFLSKNVFYLGNKENCQIVTIIIGASSNTTRLSNLYRSRNEKASHSTSYLLEWLNIEIPVIIDDALVMIVKT